MSTLPHRHAGRLKRLWLPVSMMVIAAVLGFWGFRILLTPSSPYHWLGWILIGAAILKLAVWLSVFWLTRRYQP
jgi:hypothetical protein